MQHVKFIKATDGYKVGDIAEVPNNAAHHYIDGGSAILVKFADRDDRMVGGKNTKASTMKVKHV